VITVEKTVAAFEARRNFGRILDDVNARGDQVIIERHGEPVAAVVPMSVYEQIQRNRKAFFNKMREMADRADLSPEEAEEVAEEAVRWARNDQSA
jgi:prevent-host-death family protein